MQNQNNLDALNAILFDAIRNIEKAEGEDVKDAINKGKAITDLSKQVVDIAKTKISACSVMKDLTVPAQVAIFKAVAQVSQSEVDEHKKLYLEN